MMMAQCAGGGRRLEDGVLQAVVHGSSNCDFAGGGFGAFDGRVSPDQGFGLFEDVFRTETTRIWNGSELEELYKPFYHPVSASSSPICFATEVNQQQAVELQDDQQKQLPATAPPPQAAAVYVPKYKRRFVDDKNAFWVITLSLI